MTNFLEPPERRRAHASGGGIGADQVREALFDRLIARAQGVVGCVGNLWRVLLVVAFVVERDLVGESLQLGFRLPLGQLSGIDFREISFDHRQTVYRVETLSVILVPESEPRDDWEPP